MLLGLLAACIATVASIELQHHLASHTRPFLDPALHIQLADPSLPLGWDRLGSFPSDTATLYFSLATVLLLESRILGGVGFAWTVIQFGLVRVALGWHYPSDIAGSLVLGPGCVLLLTRLRALEAALERWLERQEGRFYLVDALFCLFLADAYTLFSGARGVVHVLGMLRAIVFGQ